MDHDESVYSGILDIIRGQDEEVVSTGRITKEFSDDSSTPEVSFSDIHEAIEDLIILGEVTLIWAQQSGRVTLSRSVNLSSDGQMTLENGVWRCYIANGLRERYHSGLFDTKAAAEEYLGKVVGDNLDDLESVPFCRNVYTIEIDGFEGYGTHTVVLRGERIQHNLSLDSG